MTDQCGVRWGTHSCRYTNDGHLVGVDCECHCGDENDAAADEAGYPYAGLLDFRTASDPAYGEPAQHNYEHAIRWGPA